jgi:hypothetical protein
VTDITINSNSCHPKEQKLAAYKNWIHRLITLLLNKNNKKKELNTNIALNNGHRKEDILHICNKLKQRKIIWKMRLKRTKMGHIYLHWKLYGKSQKFSKTLT